jgi:hypothetical protein
VGRAGTFATLKVCRGAGGQRRQRAQKAQHRVPSQPAEEELTAESHRSQPSHLRRKTSGGEGIRTPGSLRHAGFQNRCLRPLGHSSKCWQSAGLGHGGAGVNGRPLPSAREMWTFRSRLSASAQVRYKLVSSNPAACAFGCKSCILLVQAHGTANYRPARDLRIRHSCTSPGWRSS